MRDDWFANEAIHVSSPFFSIHAMWTLLSQSIEYTYSILNEKN